jgi:predicted nucleic acid-binding protein
MRHLLDTDVFIAAIYARHVLHRPARAWLDAAKPAGWGIAVETYLAAVRLLMNPSVMGSGALDAANALDAVEAELAGRHPGKIVLARGQPQREIIGRAQGHKQVMDFWLVQLARQEACMLATCDAGLAANWPDGVVKIA